MKKKFIFIVIAIVVVLLLFIPRPLIRSDDLRINVYYRNQGVEEIDEAGLREILADAKIRLSAELAPDQYSAEDYPIELNILDSGKMKHLLLGKKYLYYGENSLFAYRILDGERIAEEIMALIS